MHGLMDNHHLQRSFLWQRLGKISVFAFGVARVFRGVDRTRQISFRKQVGPIESPQSLQGRFKLVGSHARLHTKM